MTSQCKRRERPGRAGQLSAGRSDAHGQDRQAVIAGLARTGRLVTCAAVIVAVSFLTLSGTPNQLVRIVASALAVGILIDAVIVRTLLVPALISLMGRWNWWLPSPLARVLRAGDPPGQ